MRLYIRHAERVHANGKDGHHSHDSPITERGREEARANARYLMDVYGKPSRIVASPFLRTRQTADEMAQAIGLDSIEIDNGIGEFLGNWPNESVRLSPETLRYRPWFGENMYELHLRVCRHLADAEKTDNVWYITHGIIISEISKITTGKRCKPKTLEHIIF